MRYARDSSRTSRRCHCVTTSSRARLIRYTGSRPTRYCVHDLVMSGFFGLCTAVLTLAAMFVVLLRLDSSLALLSLAVVPPLFICLRYYAQRMVDRAQGVKELESKLIERMYEILSGIKVVKSFAREPHELHRFEESGHATMSARLRFTWQESVFTLAVAAITLTGTALVVTVGGLHVLRGELTVGELLVVIAYLAAGTARSHRSRTRQGCCRARSPARAEFARYLRSFPRRWIHLTQSMRRKSPARYGSST